MEALTWAQEQFWGTSISDIRLQRRLADVAACIRENPCGTLPRAIRNPMALKATYRMLSNPKVTHDRILQPHLAATRTQCREPGEYLLIEDTTALPFTQRDRFDGMGPLTKKNTQGFLAHTNLGVRVQHWSEVHEPKVVVLGVFEAAARAPVLGRFTLTLRARPGVAARTANVDLHAVVAADILRLKLLAPEALTVLEIQFGRPALGWTNASTMRAIARMGGYLGRKHDGPPGWLSICCGWFRLMLMTDGYILAIQHETYG